jgi:hypothetical protein
MSAKSYSTVPLGQDRILPLTRWVAGLILPFLLVAWGILYLFPARTADLFAWPITPPMTAMLMGAGYLAGAYFFARLLRGRRWSHFAAGFPPVAAFASLMMIATFLHWDRFTQGHVSFWTWFILYLTTPFIVSGVWLVNRRVSKTAPESGDTPLPGALRLAFGVLGAALVLLGLLLFVQPQRMIAVWPWTVTPLTARALLSFFLLSALTEMSLAFRTYWSEIRYVLQGQMLGLALMLLAALLAWESLQPAEAALWLFLGAMALLLLSNAILYLSMETRRGRAVQEDRLADIIR